MYIVQIEGAAELWSVLWQEGTWVNISLHSKIAYLHTNAVICFESYIRGGKASRSFFLNSHTRSDISAEFPKALIPEKKTENYNCVWRIVGSMASCFASWECLLDYSTMCSKTFVFCRMWTSIYRRGDINFKWYRRKVWRLPLACCHLRYHQEIINLWRHDDKPLPNFIRSVARYVSKFKHDFEALCEITSLKWFQLLIVFTIVWIRENCQKRIMK